MLCASQGTRLGNQSKCPTINQLARSHNRRVRSDKCKIKWDKQTIEADSPLSLAPCPCHSAVAAAPLWRVYCVCFSRPVTIMVSQLFKRTHDDAQRSQMTHAPVPWLEWLGAWKLMSLACWPMLFCPKIPHTHTYTQTNPHTHTQSGDY